MSRWKAVVTTVGLNLLSNVTDSRAINIVSVKGGTGKVAETTLETQTAISNYKTDLQIVSGEQKADTNYQITARLANESVNANFNLTQVGVYATLGNSTTEVLFMIMQCSDEGDIIPANSLSKGFSATYQINMSFSNAENVNVVIDPIVEGLATVATSGSYNDLTDKPNTGNGVTVYTINNETFSQGLTMGDKPYVQIHQCMHRIVYVGLLSNTDKQKANNCGLFLYKNSDVQGTIGIQVNTIPTSDIKLVVADLGAFPYEGNNAIVIDGLPGEKIVTDSES